MNTANQHTDTRVWLIRFTDIHGVRRVVAQRYNALNEYMAQFPDATADEVDVLQLIEDARMHALADPWRGLYAPERMPKLDGVNDYAAWHPDLPQWPDDEERALDPLLAIQGFEAKVVCEDYPDDDQRDFDHCAWLAAWVPKTPSGDGWRLAAVADTEDGPAAWFVRPQALATKAVKP